MPTAAVRDVYRTLVPPSIREVIRRTMIGPALKLEMLVHRELKRHFIDGTEPHIQRILPRLLEAGGTFVDVGANFGGLSAAAARLVAPRGTVVCFEPVPANADRLARNMQRHRSPSLNLVLDRRAVGAASGPADIYLSFFDVCHTLDPSVNAGTRTGKLPIQQVKLDEALREHRIDRVDVLKIDVEGAELAVLRGAESALTAGRIQSVILEVCSPEEPGKADNARQVAALMEQVGYQSYLVRPTELSPWHWRDCTTRQDVLFTKLPAASFS